MRVLDEAWRGLCELFWARRCLACGDVAHHPICDLCAGDATARTGPRCPRCDLGGGRCRACRRQRPHYDRAWGVYEYESVVGLVVRAGKYGRTPGCLEWVARRLAADLPAELRRDPPAAVVPVPLHPRRVATRGCAPPLILAAAVARALAVPLRRPARRLRDTPEQVGLDARARRRNLAHAFAARRSPADVLVVDDVLTTGATLAAVARALRGAGADRVRGLAALRVGEFDFKSDPRSAS